jgi:hypothetical protein
MPNATPKPITTPLQIPRPDFVYEIRPMIRFSDGLPLGYTLDHLAGRLDGLSFAELTEFGQDVQRRYLLTMPNSDIRAIVDDRLQQLERRAKPPTPATPLELPQ